MYVENNPEALSRNNYCHAKKKVLNIRSGQEDEEEDVRSCWMTLGTEEDTLI
jgi:hypothetical protein